MKRCKTCGQNKPFDEFWQNPKTKDKLKPSCIDCCKEYNKQHYNRNKLDRIEQVKRWKRKQTKTNFK